MTMHPELAPDPLYRGPAAHTSEGSNYPIDLLVTHSAVSPCVPGGADDICAWFRNPASGGSAHYAIDPEEERQCVWDAKIAWHAPPNPHSLGFEMCDMPVPKPGPSLYGQSHPQARRQRFRALRLAWRWSKPNQRKMLRRTALLEAACAVAYDVRIRWLGVRKLRAGERDGFTSHANVSKAFGQSDHWDPGWWPRRHFMRMVGKYADRMRAGETWREIRKELV